MSILPKMYWGLHETRDVHAYNVVLHTVAHNGRGFAAHLGRAFKKIMNQELVPKAPRNR